MVVGPVRALFADEISTGLDSNTTFQIAKALRNFSEQGAGVDVCAPGARLRASRGKPNDATLHTCACAAQRM